jgi:PAS domain S-box-containing protein
MGNKLNLLIVEDDVVNCMVLETMLAKSTLQLESVDIVASLSQSFESIQQKNYDAVLLDLNLPDSNGLDTLDQIRTRFPEKAIIVITGECNEAVGLDAISRGAEDYLLKGKYSVDDLSKSVRYSIGRKESQEAARKNERIFKTLIEHLPQKILLKDRFSRFVFCNQKYAESLNLSPVDVVGKTDYDFYQPEIANNYIAGDRAVIESAETFEDVFRYESGGEEFITRVLKTAVKNETGKADGVLCVFEDFTRRFKYEEAIKQANKELEKSNLQMKEMQSQLVQSEKLASIGQLAAGVAHEINNPLGFVSSNFSTLEKYMSSIMSVLMACESALASPSCRSGFAPDNDPIQIIKKLKEDLQIDFILDDIPELFADSREGIRRIIQIVKSLRDFSRVDQMEDFSDYNINQGLQSTLAVAKNELKYATDIECDYSEVPEIFCNSGQLNQVFLNILVNAAQAIISQQRQDKGTIRIKTYLDDEYVICEIADDGPGIAEEDLPKIYDPFFTTKAVGEGTGLGLSVSYDIVVNKHKGQLSVASEVGKGTTFTIKIPLNLEFNDKQKKEVEYGSQNSLVCR